MAKMGIPLKSFSSDTFKTYIKKTRSLMKIVALFSTCSMVKKCINSTINTALSIERVPTFAYESGCGRDVDF